MVERGEQGVDAYLRGDKLIGDDYVPEEIRRWFIDEEEGYAELGANIRESYGYAYHALNQQHGFSALAHRPIAHALGLGSASGEEFRPIISRIQQITILDPSLQLKVTNIEGIPVNYERPDPLGVIGFDDSSFDLVTCFGVLHHIPNVSFVTSEIGRVLRHGCYALIREPCISMGDWRQRRPGLTAHERGIPERIMRRAIEAAGLEVVSRAYCDFAPIAKLGKVLGARDIYNNRWLTRLDALASKMFAWNIRYQHTSSFHKLAPASIYWVCRKH